MEVLEMALAESIHNRLITATSLITGALRAKMNAIQLNSSDTFKI